MLHFQRWKVILVWGIVLVGFLLRAPEFVFSIDPGGTAVLASAQAG